MLPRRRFLPTLETLEARTVPTGNPVLAFSSTQFFGRNAWDYLQETFQFTNAAVTNGSNVVTMSNTNPTSVGEAVSVTDGTTTVGTISPNSPVRIGSVSANSITLVDQFGNPVNWPGAPGVAATVNATTTETAGQFPITLVDPSSYSQSITGTATTSGTNTVVTTGSTAGFAVGQFVKVSDGIIPDLYSVIDSVSATSLTLDDAWSGSSAVTASALKTFGNQQLTLCWDLENFLQDSFSVPPQPDTNIFNVSPTLTPTLSPAALPGAVGRIAYLYDHYGTVSIPNDASGSPAQAVGLQVAIWELEYGTNFTGLQVLQEAPGNTNALTTEASQIASWVNFYLNDSLTQSQTATFLVATGSIQSNGQGVGGPGSGQQGMIVTPTINTVATPTTGTAGVSALNDTAILAGGFNPGNSITFYLFAPGVTPNATLTNNIFQQTVTVMGDGNYSTSGGPVATQAGTYEWVAVYNGDANNGPVSSTFGDEPVVISGGTPDIAITKTADQGTVAAGQTIGFTVTISNTGTADATGVKLQDKLPTGSGGDILWSIDVSGTGLGAGTNPGSFQISGPKGSQLLELNPNTGITLAAGTSLKVHMTSPTNAGDVSGGGVGVQSGVSSSVYLGAAGDYAVLYEGTGGHNLSITNVTIGGNVGVGDTGHVQFSGPGTITGRLDFSAASTGQFSNGNSSNKGPASVNYSVAVVTAALGTVNNLSSSLGGLTGTNIAISGNQTINESAGATRTVGGVEYKVFNVTSYNETDGKLVTINGDGSGDPVVFNFTFNSNINLGGDVALTGNGLSDDKVLWNFATSGKAVSLNNNASSYPGVAFHGIILAPNDKISLVNANLSGRVFGGNSSDMQIVSGVTIHAPVLNTATVTASNVTFDADDTSSASITITGATFKPAKAQVAANASATPDDLGLLGSFSDLLTGTLLAYVDNSQGNVTADEQARIDDAIAAVNTGLAAFGVNLVDVSASDLTGGADADIRITIAGTSDLGGVPEGILGLEEMGGSITIVSGWNWYAGADPAQIGANQYDFQTTVTHELGHALNLGHSTDPNSPMYWSLAPGMARRTLTTTDLTVIEDLDRGALHATPGTAVSTPLFRDVSTLAAGFVLPPSQLTHAEPLGAPGINFGPPLGPWNNRFLESAANSFVVSQNTEAWGHSSITRIDGFLFQDDVEDNWLDDLANARALVEKRTTAPFALGNADEVLGSLDHEDDLGFVPAESPARNAGNDTTDLPAATGAPWLEWVRPDESQEG
jgi:uncharacterized repeat protein (TIGR01451 family)